MNRKDNTQLAKELCKAVIELFPQGASNWIDIRARMLVNFDDAVLENDLRGVTCIPVVNAERHRPNSEAERKAFDECLGKVNERSTCVKGLSDRNTFDWGKSSDIRERVTSATDAGCGNCGEMAATAYSALQENGNSSLSKKLLHSPLARRLKGKQPLYVMRIIIPRPRSNLKKPLDHNFLIIGDMKGGATTRENVKPGSWSESAVVCDPWSFGLMKEYKRRQGNAIDYGAYSVQHLFQKLEIVWGPSSNWKVSLKVVATWKPPASAKKSPSRSGRKDRMGLDGMTTRGKLLRARP